MKENNDDRFYNDDIDDFEEFDKNEPYDDTILDEDLYDENGELYDDGEPYYEEDAQDSYDGYDEQYYDDRLSKVLDELADLKRDISSPNSRQERAVAPPNNNVNDVAMYNEISRLREELNKTQNTQNLNAELTRLKTEMERDKKMNESAFLAEIKRLNKRIEGIKKEAPALNSAKPNYNISEYGVTNADFSKLVSINETILRNAHEADAKVQNDISGIKSKLDALPNFEELNSEVNSLCQNLNGAGFMEAGEQLIAKLNMLSGGAPIVLENTKIDLSSITKAINELKGMIGSDDVAYIENLNANLSAYEQIEKLNISIDSKIPYKEKLTQVNTFLKDNKEIAFSQDIIASLKLIIDKLLSQPLNRANYTGLLAFGVASGEFTVNINKKDNINKYINFTERIETENCNVLIDILPELVTIIKEILNVSSTFDYVNIENNINNKLAELENANEVDVQKICTELIELFEQFCEIKISDVTLYSPVLPKLDMSIKHFNPQQGIFDKISEVKSVIDTLSLSLLADDSAQSKEVLKEINNIKELLLTNLSRAKSSEIFENSPVIQKIDTLIEGEDEKSIARHKMLEDLTTITKKLEQQDAYINQIVDLRADLQNIAPQTNIAPQLTKLSDEFLEQLNRLKTSILVELNVIKDKTNYTIIKDPSQIALVQESMKTVVSDNDDVPFVAIKNDFSKIEDDLTFIRSQIEANIDGGMVADDGDSYSNISSIKSDIAAIKDKLSALDEYDTVAEILSLREDVKASKIVDSNDVSSELESIKAEIADIKTEIVDLKAISNEIAHSSNAVSSATQTSESAATSDEINMLLGEIVSLRDEIQSYKDDVNNIIAPDSNGEVTLPKEDENITIILDELTGLRSELQGFKEENNNADNAEIKDGISEIKNLVSRRTTLAESENTTTASNELNIVLDQIVDLKNEIDILKQQLATQNNAAEEIQSIKEILQENNLNAIMALKEENERLTDQMQSFKDDLLYVFSAKIQEFMDASESTKVVSENIDTEIISNQEVFDEVVSLRKDVDSYKTNIDSKINSIQNTAIEPDTAVLAEVLSLREEFDRFGEYLQDNKQNLEIKDTIDEIKNDVYSIKNDEPDLSIINEVLALREEFQAFKDELNKSNNTKDQERLVSELLKEVKALRDQVFAISMANVSDGKTNEAVYESYNNIILDEVSSIREEIGNIKDEDSIKMLSEELSEIKNKLSNMAVDEKESIDRKFGKLFDLLENIQKADLRNAEIASTEQPTNDVLEQIAKLKQEFSEANNQQDSQDSPETTSKQAKSKSTTKK